VVVRLPLERLDTLDCLRLAVIPLAMVIAIASRPASGCLADVALAILWFATFAAVDQAVLEYALAAVVGVLLVAGRLPESWRVVQPLLPAGWAAVGVTAVRPIVYEVLAWGTYGEQLNVVPFQ
jgi:hypothetical protein